MYYEKRDQSDTTFVVLQEPETETGRIECHRVVNY
jgi:hypothetical protein